MVEYSLLMNNYILDRRNDCFLNNHLRAKYKSNKNPIVVRLPTFLLVPIAHSITHMSPRNTCFPANELRSRPTD